MHEHELRCYQYVKRSYAEVSGVLARDPLSLFQRATTTAADRARDLHAKLKVTVAGHEVDRDVRIEVTAVDRSGHPPAALVLPATALSFAWHAASDASLFPSMRAELTIYPLSDDETQLYLHGWYTPPGGLLGDAADAMGGHRLAEASVHRFLDDVAHRLEAEAEAA